MLLQGTLQEWNLGCLDCVIPFFLPGPFNSTYLAPPHLHSIPWATWPFSFFSFLSFFFFSEAIFFLVGGNLTNLTSVISNYRRGLKVVFESESNKARQPWEPRRPPASRSVTDAKLQMDGEER